MARKTDDDRVYETGSKIFSVRKALVAGGTLAFIIAIIAGTYYVCPPDPTGLEQCIAVSKIGINTFMGRLVAAGGVASVTNIAVFLALVRGRRLRAAKIEINSE